jgi:predicted nucleic acid-binding Zn ribbon protein
MAKKNGNKNGSENKTRLSSTQKKLRRQQIFMAIVGIILVISMVLALVMNY